MRAETVVLLKLKTYCEYKILIIYFMVSPLSDNGVSATETTILRQGCSQQK